MTGIGRKAASGRNKCRDQQSLQLYLLWSWVHECRLGQTSWGHTRLQDLCSAAEWDGVKAVPHRQKQSMENEGLNHIFFFILMAKISPPCWSLSTTCWMQNKNVTTYPCVKLFQLFDCQLIAITVIKHSEQVSYVYSDFSKRGSAKGEKPHFYHEDLSPVQGGCDKVSTFITETAHCTTTGGERKRQKRLPFK